MKISLFLIVLTVFAFSMAIYAQTTTRNVKLKEQFSLSAKHKGYVKTDKLTVEFVSVTEDSRCPTDVDCVWAGNAKVQIKVSKGKADAEVFELNTNLEPKFITFQGYKIALTDLTPVPKSDVNMKTVKYSASFIVTKN